MTPEYSEFLAHHGIKGQKWGVRRYQNEDGSLTPEGRKRFDSLSDREKKNYNTYNEMAKGIEATNNKFKEKYKNNPSKRLKRSIELNDRDIKGLREEANKLLDGKSGKQEKTAKRKATAKKIITAAGGVSLTVAAGAASIAIGNPIPMAGAAAVVVAGNEIHRRRKK